MTTAMAALNSNMDIMLESEGRIKYNGAQDDFIAHLKGIYPWMGNRPKEEWFAFVEPFAPGKDVSKNQVILYQWNEIEKIGYYIESSPLDIMVYDWEDLDA